MKKIFFAILILLFTTHICWAIPNLQIYSPDATYYDQVTETWIIPSYTYDLWVIGAHYNIFDVKIAFGVPTDEDGTITIDGWELHEGMPFEGEYVEEHDPFFIEFGTPLMGDGRPVPRGGVFPTSYYQFYIGDFNMDEIVQNYIPGDEWGDTAPGETKGFSVKVDGYSYVDIIAYDHLVLNNNKAKYVKTPYSHDGGNIPIPEPSTLFCLGLGLIGYLGYGLKRSKK